MLKRTRSFYDWFKVSQLDRDQVSPLVETAARVANNMTVLDDYHALAAILLGTRPRRIFEIGTYRGVTSDFFLQVLPEVEVVSIAFVPEPSFWSNFHRKYNNTDLPVDMVGRD